MRWCTCGAHAQGTFSLRACILTLGSSEQHCVASCSSGRGQHASVTPSSGDALPWHTRSISMNPVPLLSSQYVACDGPGTSDGPDTTDGPGNSGSPGMCDGAGICDSPGSQGSGGVVEGSSGGVADGVS